MPHKTITVNDVMQKGYRVLAAGHPELQRRQIEKNCEKGDIHCRRKQRPALLHWAYDSRRI